MNLLRYLMLLLLAIPLFSGTSSLINQSDSQKNHSTLNPHPRLFLNDARINSLKTKIQSDPYLQKVFQKLQKEASELPTAVVSLKVSKVSGAPLPSRIIQQKIILWSLMFRLTNNQDFAQSAIREMLNVAAAPDWNVPEFLKLSEVTFAMAVGYDWLYGTMSPEQKEAIQNAIQEKGLKAGMNELGDRVWWGITSTNWNIVCNAGVAIGALAVYDENPKLAKEVLVKTSLSIRNGIENFTDDGGWVEGPMYWRYASRYMAYYLDGMKTSTSQDSPFVNHTGIQKTGLFRLYSIGPSGKSFNFADSNDRTGPAPQLFWLAHRYKLDEVASFERDSLPIDQTEPFHLIWGSLDIDPVKSNLSSSRLFKKIDTAFLRNGWHKSANYAGVKGGINGTFPHSRMDLGSFVFDSQGQRWIYHLAPPSYFLPEVFGGLRWSYYRAGTQGHNTLTINGEGQYLAAPAEIVGFSNSGETSYAIVDLSAPYRKRIHSALRGLFLDDKGLTVVDEITTPNNADILWKAHTTAKVKVVGNTLLMEEGGQKYQMNILSPQNAKLEVRSIHPEASEDPESETGREYKAIQVSLKEASGQVKLVISFHKPSGELGPKPKDSLRNLINL